MKTILNYLGLCLAVICSVTTSAFAQTCGWSYSTGVNVGSTGNLLGVESNPSVIYDPSLGNIIIAGTFSGNSLTFGNYPLGTSASGTDIYLITINSSGSIVPLTIGDAWYEKLIDMKMSPTGDIYLLGTFYNPNTVNSYSPNFCPRINGSPICTVTATQTNNTSNTFLLRYATNGSITVKTFNETNGGILATSLGFDANGNPILAGSFGGTVSFNGTTFVTSTHNSPSGNLGGDGFIVKYDTNGNMQWFNQITGSGGDIVNDFVVDVNDTVHFTGIKNAGSLGVDDVIIGSVNSLGTMTYSIYTGNAGASREQGLSIALDYSGLYVYVSGIMYSPVDFGTATSPFILSPLVPNTDTIFVLKYDIYGNTIWGKTFGDTQVPSYGGNVVTKILTDNCGDLYIAGAAGYNETIQFDPSNVNAVSIVPLASYNTSFINVLDYNGNWLKTLLITNPQANSLTGKLVPFVNGMLFLGSELTLGTPSSFVTVNELNSFGFVYGTAGLSTGILPSINYSGLILYYY